MHQCIRCKTMYSNEEVPIVEGCSCGSRLFLFVKRPEDIQRAQKFKKEIEEKVQQIDREREIIEEVPVKAKPRAKVAPKKPSIETIKVHDIGVYTINIEALMKGAPIIVLSKSGSYIISFPSLFGGKVEVPLTE